MSKIKKIFEKKNFDLNSAIKKTYIDNGVGCLAVKIRKYDDVINRFSGEGFESLNREFYSFVDNNIKYIPSNVPILLQIYGCKLNDKQKKSIVENIREHYSYKLGEVIEENRTKIKKIAVFAILAFIFLALSLVTEDRLDMLSSSLNLIFCFFGSAVITFVVTDLDGPKKRRIRAGQIANMYITIEEKYNSNPITEEDKKIIYSFINRSPINNINSK